MRIVLDTNVVVSALLWGGTPYRLIEAASVGAIELYSSPALIAELAEILERSHLSTRLAEQGISAEETLVRYAQLAHIVSPTEVPRVVPSDPDDDHAVACAVLAGADVIVSGDRALLAIAHHRGIDLVTPAAAVARMASVP